MKFQAFEIRRKNLCSKHLMNLDRFVCILRISNLLHNFKAPIITWK